MSSVAPRRDYACSDAEKDGQDGNNDSDGDRHGHMPALGIRYRQRNDGGVPMGEGVIVFEAAQVRRSNGLIAITLIAARPFDGAARAVAVLECRPEAAAELRNALSAVINWQLPSPPR